MLPCSKLCQLLCTQLEFMVEQLINVLRVFRVNKNIATSGVPVNAQNELRNRL